MAAQTLQTVAADPKRLGADSVGLEKSIGASRPHQDGQRRTYRSRIRTAFRGFQIVRYMNKCQITHKLFDDRFRKALIGRSLKQVLGRPYGEDRIAR
jgi:hypothetical protein